MPHPTRGGRAASPAAVCVIGMDVTVSCLRPGSDSLIRIDGRARPSCWASPARTGRVGVSLPLGRTWPIGTNRLPRAAAIREEVAALTRSVAMFLPVNGEGVDFHKHDLVRRVHEYRGSAWHLAAGDVLGQELRVRLVHGWEVVVTTSRRVQHVETLIEEPGLLRTCC
jgi:hypothetical protein